MENGKRQAEKIVREAEEQAAALISETEAEIRKADQEMRQEADSATASQIDVLEEELTSNMKQMRSKASKKTDEAVSYIVDNVLKIEV